MKKHAAFGIVLGAVLMLSSLVFAEETAPSAPKTVTTPDGSMSIQLPSDQWKMTEDANHLLVVSDGNDLITVDHLKPTDQLPDRALANDDYAAVYQALVSTKGDVYVVKGAAVKEDDLERIMQAIGTLRILKPQAPAQTEATSEYGLRSIGAVYYVTGDDVNVRTGNSMDDEVIGCLYRGEEVYVEGVVTKDGQDTEWDQVKYKDKKAYISSKFLTNNKPVAQTPAPSSAPAQSSAPAASPAPAPSSSSGSGNAATDLVFCEYCGKWYEPGNVFRNHVCPNRDAANAAQAAASNSQDNDLVYCEYCGNSYEAGNVFRNHICPNRDAANAAQSSDSGSSNSDSNSDLVYCEYCGNYYEAGNVFRNHICPNRDAANAQ